VESPHREVVRRPGVGGDRSALRPLLPLSRWSPAEDRTRAGVVASGRTVLCRLSTGASLGSALRRRCVTLGNTEHVRSRSPNSGRCYHEETGMHLRPCNIDSSAPAQPVVDLTTLHRVSIVVPVYRGEKTLGPLLEEIVPLTQVRRTPRGHLFQVAEV